MYPMLSSLPTSECSRKETFQFLHHHLQISFVSQNKVVMHTLLSFRILNERKFKGFMSVWVKVIRVSEFWHHNEFLCIRASFGERINVELRRNPHLEIGGDVFERVRCTSSIFQLPISSTQSEGIVSVSYMDLWYVRLLCCWRRRELAIATERNMTFQSRIAWIPNHQMCRMRNDNDQDLDG